MKLTNFDFHVLSRETSTECIAMHDGKESSATLTVRSRQIPQEDVSEFIGLKTFGDGNRCFRATSLMLFGNELSHLELRVRTIVELAKHGFYYLVDSKVIPGMEAEVAIPSGKAVPG